MIPNRRLKTLLNHTYTVGEAEVLKMAAVYGANGAGKSNLIKSMTMLVDLVKKEATPSDFNRSLFRLRNHSAQQSQLLAVEFIEDKTPFYYALEILDGFIATEELYISGLGKSEDILVFERKTTPEGATAINFSGEFEADPKSAIIKSVLLEEFIQPNKTALKLIARRDNPFLAAAKKAFQWFRETLQILTPKTRPVALTQMIGEDQDFKAFAEHIVAAINLGIRSMHIHRQPFDEFIREHPSWGAHKLRQELESAQDIAIAIKDGGGEEFTIVKDEKEIWVEKLILEHIGADLESKPFEISDESDGTIRLLDFIPAFRELYTKECVYLIDEMERSIHPSLMKQLIQLYSQEHTTMGQLVFTTHESNLLDQDIFRQDEVWFVEKDRNGSSSLYSLGDFKEHKTIDIRKGYLAGRYGSIPFLGHLETLNWEKNAAE
jgi:hypothetical protein